MNALRNHFIANQIHNYIRVHQCRFNTVVTQFSTNDNERSVDSENNRNYSIYHKTDVELQDIDVSGDSENAHCYTCNEKCNENEKNPNMYINNMQFYDEFSMFGNWEIPNLPILPNIQNNNSLISIIFKHGIEERILELFNTKGAIINPLKKIDISSLLTFCRNNKRNTNNNNLHALKSLIGIESKYLVGLRPMLRMKQIKRHNVDKNNNYNNNGNKNNQGLTMVTIANANSNSNAIIESTIGFGNIDPKNERRSLSASQHIPNSNNNDPIQQPSLKRRRLLNDVKTNQQRHQRMDHLNNSHSNLSQNQTKHSHSNTHKKRILATAVPEPETKMRATNVGHGTRTHMTPKSKSKEIEPRLQGPLVNKSKLENNENNITMDNGNTDNISQRYFEQQQTNKIAILLYDSKLDHLTVTSKFIAFSQYCEEKATSRIWIAFPDPNPSRKHRLGGYVKFHGKANHITVKNDCIAVAGTNNGYEHANNQGRNHNQNNSHINGNNNDIKRGRVAVWQIYRNDNKNDKNDKNDISKPKCKTNKPVTNGPFDVYTLAELTVSSEVSDVDFDFSHSCAIFMTLTNHLCVWNWNKKRSDTMCTHYLNANKAVINKNFVIAASQAQLHIFNSQAVVDNASNAIHHRQVIPIYNGMWHCNSENVLSIVSMISYIYIRVLFAF